jgi:hypothetical protein
MTEEEIEKVLTDVCGDPAAGTQPRLTASQAIPLLTAGGLAPPLGMEAVFCALGGATR